MPRRIATIGRAVLLATPAASGLARPTHDGARRARRPAIDPSVAAAFARNANAGPGAAAALNRLLARHPGLAVDIAAELRGASPHRRGAAGALAEARQTWSQSGDQLAANQLGGVADSTDPRGASAFENAAGRLVASQNDSGRRGGPGVRGGGVGCFRPGGRERQQSRRPA
jgi:hypothetical protein